MFQINVKIEEGAALALCSYPFGKLSDGNVGRTVLKFISCFCLRDFLARRDQLLRQPFVSCALGRIQRFRIAVESRLLGHCRVLSSSFVR